MRREDLCLNRGMQEGIPVLQDKSESQHYMRQNLAPIAQ